MSKGGSKVKETPQQRAMAEHAANLYADYKKRWLPVQQNLAAQVQEMGKADSSARHLATGKAATDTAAQFAGAQGALEKTLANSTGLGSSRAKLAITGMGEDRAKATGLGTTIADQQIDDAYTEALGALAATGRGERAQVSNSLTRQAGMSAHQAQADAQAALTERMGQARVVGTVAGYGMQRWMKESEEKAQKSAPGTVDTTGLTFSAPAKPSGTGLSGGPVAGGMPW